MSTVRGLSWLGKWGMNSTPPTKTVISRPQVLHYILLRISPLSFRNWIAIDCSQKRRTRKNRFGAPSSLIIRRPKENLGTYWHLRNRSSYSEVTWSSCSTIIFVKDALLCTQHLKRREHSLQTKRVALWVWKRKRRQQWQTREWAKDRVPVTAV